MHGFDALLMLYYLSSRRNFTNTIGEYISMLSCSSYTCRMVTIIKHILVVIIIIIHQAFWLQLIPEKIAILIRHRLLFSEFLITLLLRYSFVIQFLCQIGLATNNLLRIFA